MGFDVNIDDTARIKYPELVHFGDHVSVDMCVYCSVKMHTGDWVHIAPHVSIIGGRYSELTIGHLAGISTGGRIVCGSEDFVNSLLGFVPDEFKTVIHGHNIISDYAWVGANAVMLPNLTLAEGSVLGAGAVLTKNTEPWTVYAGVPAVPIKKRNKEEILRNAKRLGYGR